MFHRSFFHKNKSCLAFSDTEYGVIIVGFLKLDCHSQGNANTGFFITTGFCILGTPEKLFQDHLKVLLIILLASFIFLITSHVRIWAHHLTTSFISHLRAHAAILPNHAILHNQENNQTGAFLSYFIIALFTSHNISE